MKVIRGDAAHPSDRGLIWTYRTGASDGARRGCERVNTYRFHQRAGTIDCQAGVSASFDRRAGVAARGSGAVVSGDAEIANSYRELLAFARPDFEEELSRLIGDVPARALSQFAAKTVEWAARARRTTSTTRPTTGSGCSTR